MENLALTGLRTINELLTAGIAITAFSLLLYVLTFNLNDRVTRSFTIILVCVTIIFVAETLGSVASSDNLVELWLKIPWIGIVFLPAAYLHFSDALLETTGRPSRGRRRFVVRLAYLGSVIFLITLPLGWLVGSRVEASSVPHLARTPLSWVFAFLYLVAMAVSGANLWRSYQRTVTRTSRRRMAYLMIGALAPALGTYPFMIFASGKVQNTLIFWLLVVIGNAAFSVLLVLMAYAVAFFGVSWPDRVIKRRLAKWLLRGPVTASLVLASTTIVRRIGLQFGAEYTALVPFIMVGTILVLEHTITLTAPIWERLLFRGSERADILLLQTLEERLLTGADLQQFLDALLAAVCDRLQVTSAFIASMNAGRVDLLLTIGGDDPPGKDALSANLTSAAEKNGARRELFTWGDFWLAPIYDSEKPDEPMLGLLGFKPGPDQVLDSEQEEALSILTERAATALIDRYRQQQAFISLEALTPEIDMIQQLRAASRYDSAEVLSRPALVPAELEEGRLAQWVRDALNHYWGGPKLTQSPLIKLKVVEATARQNEENPTNALRLVLRQAIEQTRPEGERKFTADWILFNILEMKFVEGRKVREIASRLAMSEADLYRKQRVAIESVAKTICEMEQEARQEQALVKN
jgi:hypothetical protein